MSNEVRYTLLKLLNNDAIAFKTANAFVADDSTKLKAFQDAYAELVTNNNVQNRASEAVSLADNRWSVISIPSE